MFSKMKRLCESKNIQWHVNKFSNMFYSSHINPSLRNPENRSLPTYNVIPQPRLSASEEERQYYTALFPKVVKDLTEPFKHIPEVTERYEKVLEYTVMNQKQASGLAVINAYKAFESPEKITSKNMHRAYILSWCVDLLLSSWKVTDDIMDGSETRRGLPCWYKVEEVGARAINDAVLLDCGPSILLKKYLSDYPTYVACSEWLRSATLKTAFGQSLDTLNTLNGKPKLDLFTRTRHKCIAKYKGAIPEYSTPIKLAMYFAGVFDPNLHQQVDKIIIGLGDFLTVQNDILDCYGDPSITGKMGSDIREGKCSWPVVIALQRATPAQRQILKEHYGRPDANSESKVRSVYEQLGIFDEFLIYEKNSFDDLRRNIQRLSNKQQRDFFYKMVDTTFGYYDSHD